VTNFSDRPAIPARPAVYIRDPRAKRTDDIDEDLDLGEEVRNLSWPEPVVYAEAGKPGRQLAALTEAISTGQVDGVFAAHPADYGDLTQIEAFDLLCRRHGVILRFSWFHDVTDTRALFDVVREAREFTVTKDHLRLLRRTYVWWDEAEFGAPAIDAKRPYGNSHVIRDIAEILDVPEGEWSDEEGGDDEDGSRFPEAEWRFLRLHVETAVALQIALATGEFRTGRYVRKDKLNHRKWKRAGA